MQQQKKYDKAGSMGMVVRVKVDKGDREKWTITQSLESCVRSLNMTTTAFGTMVVYLKTIFAW
jgi:hypothetical protein